MHICFVCREYPPSLRGGGIASYIKEVAHGLHDAGHRVTVIAASDDTRISSDDDEEGVRVIRLSGGDFVIPQVEGNSILKKFRPLYKFYQYRNRLRDVINSIPDIDIIEVAEFGAESLFLDKINIPVVVRLHAPSFVLDKIVNQQNSYSIKGLMRSFLGDQEKKILHQAKYVTSCSAALAKIVHAELAIPLERINVIFNPIQIERWKYEDKSFNYRSPIRLLLPGTITQLKGGIDLIEACQSLRSEGIDLELTLVGKESRFADYLRSNYAEEQWLIVRGPVERAVLMDMYKSMDIVCVPSWFENMPMTCIESMLLGCIVVATNVGGIPEIITHGENGFLVDSHSPKQLASAIKQVLNLSDEEKKTISKAARERIISQFDMSKIQSQLIAYYKDVINDFKKE